MLVVTLVRHGETIANKSRTIQGQMDGCLTKLGALQAERLGNFLSQDDYDLIICSDLLRTQQTAACIMKSRSSQHIYLDSLVRERSAGVIEGQRHGTQEKLAKAAGIPFRHYRPDGGENWDDVKVRAHLFGKQLTETLLPELSKEKSKATDTGDMKTRELSKEKSKTTASGDNQTRVLVVTHGGFIKEFINQWCMQPCSPHMYPNKARNTAVYKFSMHIPAGKSQPIVNMDKENDVSHLSDWECKEGDLSDSCNVSLQVLDIQKVTWNHAFAKY